jgi:hypothetical protein
MLDESLFKSFELERICIDKVFFVVYDSDYAMQMHPFDKDLRDRFIQHVKRSRVQKGRMKEVIRKENNYSSWELALDKSRTMFFHVNVIHMLQDLKGIQPKNVIYDDNFMPVEDYKLSAVDYVKALKRFVFDAMSLYKQLVSTYWDTSLNKVHYKIVEIELPYEIYPASVEDIANQMYAQGLTFKKYNTQSGTIYLDKPESPDNCMKFADRKYDKNFVIPSDDDLRPDIVYINKIDSNRTDSKVQLKIYQKTFGLVRIETTAFAKDAMQLFDFEKYQEHTIVDSLIQYIHHILTVNGIKPERYDRSLDDVVRFLSVALKESEDMIYRLRNMDIFETNSANRVLRQRLVRKGILMPKTDSDGIRKRGLYLVNPIIKNFLQQYQPKGNEHFIGSGLCPDLLE